MSNNNFPEFIPNERIEREPNATQSKDVYTAMVQEERVNNFLSQTSPLKTLEEIDYKLKGFMYSREERKWKKLSDGINPKIRMDIMQMLTSLLSEDARMTRLDSLQINGLMEFLIEWIVDYLDNVADEFEMDETQLTKIGLIVLSAVFLTLLRSHEGVERGEIFDSLRLGENLNQQSQQQHSSGDWWKVWK